MRPATLMGALAGAFFTVVAQGGGFTHGNGDSIGAQQMTYAYAKLGWEIDLCLADIGECGLAPDETLTMEKIRASYDIERRLQPQLNFKSGTQNPGFFVVDGETQIAKTGDSVGDVVFVNTDLLYVARNDGTREAIGIPAASAVLVREFGQHQGIKDRVKLDALGLKLKNFLLKYIQGAVSGGLNGVGIGVDLLSGTGPYVMPPSGREDHFVLLFYDSTRLLDLSSVVERALLSNAKPGDRISSSGLFWDLPRMEADGKSATIGAHLMFNGVWPPNGLYHIKIDLQFDVAKGPTPGAGASIKDWRVTGVRSLPNF